VGKPLSVWYEAEHSTSTSSISSSRARKYRLLLVMTFLDLSPIHCSGKCSSPPCGFARRSPANLRPEPLPKPSLTSKSVRIPIIYYHNNLSHFIFLELMTKSNVIKIVFSLSAMGCRLKAKLLNKGTNPSSNRKQFIEEIQTNDWKSNNDLLQRYLNALGGDESGLMEEDRNNFVEFLLGNWSWKSFSIECFRKRL
jgi:hypothetical protein